MLTRIRPFINTTSIDVIKPYLITSNYQIKKWFFTIHHQHSLFNVRVMLCQFMRHPAIELVSWFVYSMKNCSTKNLELSTKLSTCITVIIWKCLVQNIINSGSLVRNILKHQITPPEYNTILLQYKEKNWVINGHIIFNDIQQRDIAFF